MFAALHFRVVFLKTKNPASHENMGCRTLIRLDLVETFVHPINTVLAFNHGLIQQADSAAGMLLRFCAGQRSHSDQFRELLFGL